VGLLFFLWLGVVGLFIGAMARLIVPGRNRMSMTLTILVGLAGSFLGGIVGDLLLGDEAGILLSILVAAVLVWLVNADRSSSSVD
jgi:uncharacterized membrane protein YeaQ/YmgE (transglycosylase-associated protein family)